MKMYMVNTNLFGTKYFVGLFKSLKEAKECQKMYEGSKIEVYYE